MIFTRLGYRKTTTLIDKAYKKKLESSIKTGLSLCDTKGVFQRCEIISKDVEFVELGNGAIFQSASLSKLLENSQELVLMAATVGSGIVERISKEIKSGDAAFGVVLDAVASETADSALDWMMNFINRMMMREARRLTRMRYSPGYGDLPLSCQKIIFDMLELDRLDLNITEKFMLVPEKSVIAIAGVEGIDSNE